MLTWNEEKSQVKKFVFLCLNLVELQEKLILLVVILVQQDRVKAPFASCKHIAALCYALGEFVRTDSSNRDYQTCTSRLETWYQYWWFSFKIKLKYQIAFYRFRSYRLLVLMIFPQGMLSLLQSTKHFLKTFLSGDAPRKGCVDEIINLTLCTLQPSMFSFIFSIFLSSSSPFIICWVWTFVL